MPKKSRSARDRTIGFVRTFGVLVGATLLAGSAAAQGITYPLLHGVWSRGDGIEVDVPFVGKTVGNCDFIKQGQNNFRAAGQSMTMFMQYTPGPSGTPHPNAWMSHPSKYTGTSMTTGGATIQTGFMVNKAANFGCLQGTATNFYATANAEGAAFTLPTNLVSRPRLDMLVAVPIPNAPNLLQASTDGDWYVPHSQRVGGDPKDRLGWTTTGPLGLGILTIGPTQRTPVSCTYAPGTTPPAAGVMTPQPCNNLAPLNRFEADAWQNQSGRAGPSFTWCPGKPGCVTINEIGVSDGMIIRYKAGPNRFGGTIAQIVHTNTTEGLTGRLFVNLGGDDVDVQILDAGEGAIQATGRGYADFLTDLLMAATMGYTSYMVAPVMNPTLMQTVTLITQLGDTQAPLFPAGTNQKWGFPLTTGTVIVRNTNMAPLGKPVVTITGMGYDKLLPETPGGSPTSMANGRVISLVAGGVANLRALGVNTSTMGQLFLPEPDRSGQLLAGALGLAAVAAWRARARRR